MGFKTYSRPKEIFMSMAKRVTEADSLRQWFAVEDDAKAVWRFQRTEHAPRPEAVVHMTWENTPGTVPSRPVFLLADDGQPRLRQEAPGLPEKAVVAVDDMPPPGPGGLFSSQAFFTMTVEFKRAELG
jgi:hypothetical protein